VVHYSILFHSFLEVNIDLLDDCSNLSDPFLRSAANTSGDDVHINLSSCRVSCTLLHCGLNESDSFLHISLLNSITESHFGKSFSDSDHGFQLSGGGSDGLPGVAEGSHLGVLRDEFIHNVVWNGGTNVSSGIGNILGKKFSFHLTRFNKLGHLVLSISSCRWA